MGTEFSARLKTCTSFPVTCKCASKITNPGLCSPGRPTSNGCSILIRPSVGGSSETLLVKLPTRLLPIDLVRA